MSFYFETQRNAIFPFKPLKKYKLLSGEALSRAGKFTGE